MFIDNCNVMEEEIKKIGYYNFFLCNVGNINNIQAAISFMKPISCITSNKTFVRIYENIFQIIKLRGRERKICESHRS